MAGIELKTEHEFELMRKSGKIVAELLLYLEKQIAPGITTKKLDELAEKFIRSKGAEPSFKGYHGYPASICASVNEVIVHGIPGKNVLKTGDIVGIDVGAMLDGFHADAARTFAVGNVDVASQRLIDVTRESLNRGIQKARSGGTVGDISSAVQKHAESNGLSVVREYVGHGIGRSLHEDPQVPNFGREGTGPKLVAGMAIAIEPMLNLGTHEASLLEDGWTVVTKDGKRSGHFEDTVLIGKGFSEVITRLA